MIRLYLMYVTASTNASTVHTEHTTLMTATSAQSSSMRRSCEHRRHHSVHGHEQRRGGELELDELVPLRSSSMLTKSSVSSMYSSNACNSAKVLSMSWKCVSRRSSASWSPCPHPWGPPTPLPPRSTLRRGGVVEPDPAHLEPVLTPPGSLSPRPGRSPPGSSRAESSWTRGWRWTGASARVSPRTSGSW